MVKLDGASKKRTDYRTEYPVQLYGKRKNAGYMRLKGIFFFRRLSLSIAVALRSWQSFFGENQ